MGREVGGGFRSEGTHVHLWPIHIDIRQKPGQYCKVIILQFKNKLEKEMATHSRTLAWRIPWTEEQDRLQSTRPQSVGRDCATGFQLS